MATSTRPLIRGGTQTHALCQMYELRADHPNLMPFHVTVLANGYTSIQVIGLSDSTPSGRRAGVREIARLFGLRAPGVNRNRYGVQLEQFQVWTSYDATFDGAV